MNSDVGNDSGCLVTYNMTDEMPCLHWNNTIKPVIRENSANEWFVHSIKIQIYGKYNNLLKYKITV